jgi:hypothetical protein
MADKAQPQRSSVSDAAPMAPPKPVSRAGWREPIAPPKPFGFLRFLAGILALLGVVTVVMVPLALYRTGERSIWVLALAGLFGAVLGIGQICFSRLIAVALAVESHLKKLADRDFS